MIKPALLSLLTLSLCFTACDSGRVYEENTDLAEGSWHKDSVLTFPFTIEQDSLPYNIYYNLRNALAYPAYNIYLGIEIQDSTGQTLRSDLNNIELFDPKTGKPFGDGLGDIFDHQILVFEGYEFPYEGPYQIVIENKVREDMLIEEQLPYIMSVGIRIEKDLSGTEN